MAPGTVADIHASKRKSELDDRGQRKRTKHERSLLGQGSGARKLLNGNEVTPANGLPKPSVQEESHVLDVVKVPDPVARSQRPEGPGKGSSHTMRKSKGRNAATWRISQPMGGRILDIDPILTNDGKYLILAYNTSIQTYSTSDSLLVRKIPLRLSAAKREQIVSVRPSATLSDHVWVASSAGSMWLINWITGEGATRSARLECDLIHDTFVDTIEPGQKSMDVLFVSARKGQKWHLFACNIQQDLNAIEHRILFTHTSAIQNLQSAQSGRILAASTDKNILLGVARSEPVATSLGALAYEVFSFDVGEDDITCLDLRTSERVHLTQRSQRDAANTPVVDIAVGCSRGAIFRYQDLLPQVRGLRNSKGRQYSLQPQKYHWHRKAVHAVKWSRDGNYLVSGGSESTLVIWQLDTAKPDFLPHLSATIKNIVISTSGSAYVLHLNDNSAMILSTTEMKPTTYISGVQTLLTPQPPSKDDVVRRVGQYMPSRLSKIPAALNPTDPSRISLCVGTGLQPTFSGSGPSMPLIQTLDLTTMQNISKQALTRTNTTDVNINAKGYAITEPRITDMVYSHDGRWLATIDEWQPPFRDLDVLDGSSADRREVYLKFWSVPETTSENEDQEGKDHKQPKDHTDFRLGLLTRINAPHRTSQIESVFDVAADPKADRFATIGGDGIIRLWEPTTRKRDGIILKSKTGHKLQTWACCAEISLHGNEAAGDLDGSSVPTRSSGAVAFSEDGSTLVGATSNEHGSTIHIIDTESGKIRNSLSGLIIGDIQGLKVLSSNLIVLSDALMVFDLVQDELRYGFQLRMNDDTHGPGASLLSHLAVDHETARFAVAIARSKDISAKSELAVFNTEDCEPEVVHQFPRAITSLVPMVGSSGFLALDAAAQLWAVNKSMDTKAPALAQPLADLDLDRGLTDEAPETVSAMALLKEDDGSASEGEQDVVMADGEADSDETYPAVVAPQRLTEIFDAAPSFAMPPIEDLLYKVTKLFSPKPTVSAT
ncbi:WD40 repeat-like protein [Xylariaceae sp. FL0804]|nr:WD40 repeat-like protein [Xylariaceae sp. FL0804]